MNAPTDPLPEPLYWYEYTPTGWGARTGNHYSAWTFNPKLVNIEWLIDGYEDDKPDVWVVRSQDSAQRDNEQDAVFLTRDEATRYISVRAMLGTFELREEP